MTGKVCFFASQTPDSAAVVRRLRPIPPEEAFELPQEEFKPGLNGEGNFSLQNFLFLEPHYRCPAL